MVDQLSQFIAKMKANRKLKSYSEDEVKQVVILPILRLVGWDIFDIDEVRPEYKTKGGRVDYSLRIKRSNRFFIEVKKPAEELDKHQEQLLGYSYRKGVELAALTSGLTWWFYLPKENGDWEERKFDSLDVNKDDSAIIADKLVKILAKYHVESSQAWKYAKEIYDARWKQRQIEGTIPEAWDKLISEPDTLLLELLAETTEGLCGFRPEDSTVTEFLSSHREELLLTGAERVGVKRPKAKVGKKRALRVTRTRTGRRSRANKGHSQIQDYIVPLIKMMRQGTPYREAFRKQAATLGVHINTVSNQCTRAIGITTSEFVERVSNGTIVSFLRKRYPQKTEIIDEELER